MASTEQPVWIFRARPYDLATGVERNVWFATTAIASDEPFEGWLQLDGSNDWVAVPLALALDLSNAFYVEAVRFRTDVQQAAVLMVTGDMTVAGGVSSGTMLYLEAPGGVSNVVTAHSDAVARTELTFPTDYADGEWHTLLAIRTTDGFSNVLRLYYDGVNVSSGTPGAIPELITGTTMHFGANSAGGDEFDGDIERAILLNTDNLAGAEALLASRDLTSSVVDGAPVSGLVAAYPINEGYGARVQDVSGNGHHGTINAGGVATKWSRIAPPPGTIPGLLQDPFRVSSSLIRGGSTLSSSALPSFGAVRSLNPDGEIDHLLTYSWSGRLVEQMLGTDGDAVTGYDVIWVGQSEEPSGAGRDEMRVGIRGIEDVFEEDIQTTRYEPGFEPSVIGDGVDNMIDFGVVLNHAAGEFTFGANFYADVEETSIAMLYGKDSVLGGAGTAGYGLGFDAFGAVAVWVSDGVNQFFALFSPLTTYADGELHKMIAQVDNTNDELRLYYDQVLVDATDITGLGSLANAVSLTALASGGVPSQFSNARVERVVQTGGAGPVALDRVMSSLDERYAGDVDPVALALSHYVPLTENSGTLVGDLSASGFDGTLSGDADSDKLWSGTPHGNVDIEGEPLPILLGRVSLRRGVLVDPIKLIYQVSDSNLFDVFSVREGFVPLDEDTTTTGPIWTNAPVAGTWRWRVEVVDGTSSAFFRLGSQPTGTITFSADSTNVDANPSTAYPGEHARSVANRVTSSILDGLAQLNIDAPYVSGHYWSKPISARRAMDEALAGAGAHWTVDPRNPYDLTGNLRVTVFQAKDLSGATPSATYLLDPDDRPSDFEFEGLKETGVAPVYRSVTVRYKRYGESLSLSEPQGTVRFDLINEMTEEWRSVVRPAGASTPSREEILERFLGATDYEKDTGIWTRSGSVTEAERLVALYNRHNRIYEGELTANLFAHWIGDVVDITGKRLIGDNVSTVTLRFLVAGVTDDAKNSGTVLDLWGGFEPA